MPNQQNSRHSLYFEAIIQLRPLKEEVFNFIVNHIDNRNDCEITQTKKLKTGIDIYVTSQKFARALGKKLKKTFKGTLKSTRSLHTQSRQTGKRLYRVTVLFRPD
jgi:nonsense-mediated mRNA decay protein 3